MSQADLVRWRRDVRPRILQSVAHRLRGLKWSPRLLAVLLDELQVSDELEAIVGDFRRVPIREYGRTLALAVALRHSWKPDDLAWLTRQLRLRHTPRGPQTTRRKVWMGKVDLGG